jgi:hypothetical protein
MTAQELLTLLRFASKDVRRATAEMCGQAADEIERLRAICMATPQGQALLNDARLVNGELVVDVTDCRGSSFDVQDDGKCWIKGCQQPKGHAGFCDPLPGDVTTTQTEKS